MTRRVESRPLRRRASWVALVWHTLLACVPGGADDAADDVEDELVTPIVLNDNGAWSWFMDDRAVVHGGKLVVGSVRSVEGNVEVACLDLESLASASVVLHAQFEQDDHDNPAFLPLADGGLLAVYTKHNVERTTYWRSSAPGDPLSWSEAGTFDAPSNAEGPDHVTYANLFRWTDGRIYNFYRGYGRDANYLYSDDEGSSWTFGGRWLEGYGSYSPYLRYAYDGDGTLHFIATEDHPRNYDTSIFHGFIRDGLIHDSSGEVLAAMSESLEAGLEVWDLSLVFAGDPDNVAWVIDIELDADGDPYIAFSTQRDSAGLPRGQGGDDLRYYYGRWDGEAWFTEEIAYAGTRLYSREDDYSGLVALDPHDPDVAFISTNADPVGGEPLISAADGQRHYELYRGVRGAPGQPWDWRALTRDSAVDNLRPIVPRWDDERTALVWMRGSYHDNRGSWTTAVVAAILP